ncbi:peptidoglycan DD-metalloendopeptidase family protein [Propionibacteriaceae bacterium G1746]|uniref:peptidoglycan DD-metalloendopeptidase family protein n=1 Tax=Aestuariimicrobium sp. G57 TaxID=3418485 RepID=UPI003C18991B
MSATEHFADHVGRRSVLKFAPAALAGIAGIGLASQVVGEAAAAQVFSSPVEVGARPPWLETQRFGNAVRLHAGTDYAPPTAGVSGGPITAIAGGTVLRTGRGNGGSTSVTLPYHSGLAVIIDHGTVDGNRLYSYYGHLKQILVTAGTKVQPGTRVGTMGGSGATGANDFAVHLHMGIFVNDPKPVYSRYGSAYRDPAAWFASKGIVPGTTRPVVPGVTGTWPEVALPVTDYHTAASHAAWVKLMYDIGYRHSSLSVNLQNWLKAKGYYTGAVDGVFGPVSVKALQRLLRDRGFYGGVIDGDRGPLTVRAEINFLNDQRKYY